MNDPVYTHGLTVGLIVGLSRCESMSSVSCDLIVAVVIHHPVLASPAVIRPPVTVKVVTEVTYYKGLVFYIIEPPPVNYQSHKIVSISSYMIR